MKCEKPFQQMGKPVKGETEMISWSGAIWNCVRYETIQLGTRIAVKFSSCLQHQLLLFFMSLAENVLLALRCGVETFFYNFFLLQ